MTSDNEMSVKSIKDEAQELKEQYKQVDEDLDNFETLYPESAQAIKYFWKGLGSQMFRISEALGKKSLKDAFVAQGDMEKLRPKQVRTFWDRMLTLAEAQAKSIPIALDTFGISEQYFDDSIRRDPDRLLVEIDTVADKLSEAYTERINDYENGTERSIAKWKKYYPELDRMEDSDINELDLLFRRCGDLEFADTDEMKALMDARERFKGKSDYEGRLVAVNKYRTLLDAVILARQGKILKETQEKIKEAEDKLSGIEESIDEKAADEKLADSRLKGLMDMIDSNEKHSKDVQNNINRYIDLLNKERDQAIRQRDDAHAQLEVEQRRYDAFVASHSQRPGFEPRKGGVGAFSDRKVSNPEQASNKGNAQRDDLKEDYKGIGVMDAKDQERFKSYFIVKDSKLGYKWVRRIPEKNNSYITMTKDWKMHGRISAKEFTRLEANNLLIKEIEAPEAKSGDAEDVEDDMGGEEPGESVSDLNEN